MDNYKVLKLISPYKILQENQITKEQNKVLKCTKNSKIKIQPPPHLPLPPPKKTTKNLTWYFYCMNNIIAWPNSSLPGADSKVSQAHKSSLQTLITRIMQYIGYNHISRSRSD